MLGRLLVVAALMLVPSVHADVAYAAEARGCAMPGVGGAYRSILATAGVADCTLALDVTLAPACADDVCVVSAAGSAAASSGHPGAKSLVLDVTVANDVTSATSVVCSAEGDALATELACAGDASAAAAVDGTGCVVVILSAGYEEELRTGVLQAEARWRLCAADGVLVFLN